MSSAARSCASRRRVASAATSSTEGVLVAALSWAARRARARLACRSSSASSAKSSAASAGCCSTSEATFALFRALSYLQPAACTRWPMGICYLATPWQVLRAPVAFKPLEARLLVAEAHRSLRSCSSASWAAASCWSRAALWALEPRSLPVSCVAASASRLARSSSAPASFFRNFRFCESFCASQEAWQNSAQQESAGRNKQNVFYWHCLVVMMCKQSCAMAAISALAAPSQRQAQLGSVPSLSWGFWNCAISSWV